MEVVDVDGAECEHVRHMHKPKRPLACSLAFGEVFQMRYRDVSGLALVCRSVGSNSSAGGTVGTSSPGELLIHRVAPE